MKDRLTLPEHQKRQHCFEAVALHLQAVLCYPHADSVFENSADGVVQLRHGPEPRVSSARLGRDADASR